MTDVPLFRRRSHSVLVIEDDSANRRLLATMLTREHSTVRTAADGEGGLIAALAPDFDLILLEHRADRPYRDALSLDIAIDEIRTGTGRQFDPSLAPLFVDIVETSAARLT